MSDFSMNIKDYKMLSLHEQILLRPDTYVGSVKAESTKQYTIVDWKGVKKNLKISPALFKIYDEIITNASDHTQRAAGVKEIRIYHSDGIFRIWNDGKGIPVSIHPDYSIYVPEMIFSYLLTGSNYDDTEDRTGAGRNGYGSKLTNIFSKQFIINCADGKNSYYQEFTDNMHNRGEAVVKSSKKNFTEITFLPDYERFGLSGIDEDHLSLFMRRACDVMAFTGVKVYWNDIIIPIKSFKDYALMFAQEDEVFYEKLDDNWEIGISYNEEQFDQFSLVNGINTPEGGTHVNYIMDKIAYMVRDELEKKHKNIKLRPVDIKNKITLYLNVKIVNPEFSSQSKENLKTSPDKFLSRPDIPQKLIKKILDSEIVESILNWIKAKEMIELKKLNKEKNKSSRVRVEKLSDANLAGTDQSEKCMLFAAEGNSAASAIGPGAELLGLDFCGVFELKGKSIGNVREMDIKKLIEKKEVSNLITALGLEIGKKYKDTTELRYGKLILATDQDFDGAHIKGLILNMFHYFWPELLKIGYVSEFQTPIIRIKKGKTVKDFYKIQDYLEFADTNPGWSAPEYKKGLGAWEREEMIDLFSRFNDNLIQMDWNETTDEKIDMCFNKKRADNRKEWLSDIAFEVKETF
jgi:DNA topoisomerase-2